MNDQLVAIYMDLSERLTYQDGDLVWTITHQPKLIGKKAGRPDRLGYLHIHGKSDKMIAAHRLIFFMHHGWLPECIDHIDGDNRNNRIDNLRAASVSQNMRNCKTPATNTSGVKGVYFHRQTEKWTASIRVNKRLTHLGSFTHIFDAACARKAAEQIHYGEFAR